jgi:hypothetical protein
MQSIAANVSGDRRASLRFPLRVTRRHFHHPHGVGGIDDVTVSHEIQELFLVAECDFVWVAGIGGILPSGSQCGPWSRGLSRAARSR